MLSEIESDMSSEGGHGPNTSASMPVLSSVPEEHGTGTQAMDESAQAGAAFVQLAARPLAGAPLPQDVTMADAAAGARAQPQAPQGAAQAQGGSPFQFSKIMTAAAAAHDAVAGRPTVQPKPAPPPKPAPSAAAAVKVQQQQQQQAAAAQAAAAGKPYRPTLGTTGAPGFKLVSEFTRHFKLGRELGKGHFSSVCHARLREKPLTNEQLAAMEPRRADAPPGTPAAARLIEARLNQALNLQPPPSPPSPGASKPAPQPDGGAQAGAEVSAEAAAIMAQHAQYPPEVAVKILRKPSSEKQMELLMREVEICNLLSGHRAFCTLLDRFESEDSFYLVLEVSASAIPAPTAICQLPRALAPARVAVNPGQRGGQSSLLTRARPRPPRRSPSLPARSCATAASSSTASATITTARTRRRRLASSCASSLRRSPPCTPSASSTAT